MEININKWRETKRKGMLKYQENQRKRNLAKLKAGTLYKMINPKVVSFKIIKTGIPLKWKEEMKVDPYYQKCCLTGNKKKDGYKIDWHHAWEYSGRQIQEKWAIMPIWWKKHAAVNGDDDSVHNCKETELKVQYLSLCRVNLENLKMRMPKKDWDQEFKVLQNKFEDG